MIEIVVSSLNYCLRSLWQISRLDPRGLAHEMHHYRPLSVSVPIELIQITFSHTLFKTRVLTDKNFDMKYIWTNVYVNGVHLTFFWRTGHTSGKCCVKPNCWQSMNILDHWSMTIYWFPLLKVFANLLETELQKYFLIYDKFKHFCGD